MQHLYTEAAFVC